MYSLLFVSKIFKKHFLPKGRDLKIEKKKKNAGEKQIHNTGYTESTLNYFL